MGNRQAGGRSQSAVDVEAGAATATSDEAAPSNLFSKGGTFSRDQLEDYQDCTFFTKKDILRLFKRFRALNPLKVPTNMQANRPSIVTLTFEEVEKMPELRVQKAFLYFELGDSGKETQRSSPHKFASPNSSVLSEMAPLELKLKYAFRCYDFDQDDFVGMEDLRKTILYLTREELTSEEVTFIAERVIEEADLDGDRKIGYAEFEHVVSRSPDFMRTFHIRI